MNQPARPVRTRIHPREVDVGGFQVRRCLPAGASLPAAGIPGAGPWVFFDHIGPGTFPSGRGLDVIPHPHIGLATVTYLFEGELVHRDSIGSVQTISPGAVNLMVAGAGIVHSERTGPALRAAGHRLHGLQLWFALPEEVEESEPTFRHYPAADLPSTRIGAASLRVLIGGAWGLRSPVPSFSPTLYAEARLPAGGNLPLPPEAGELALYVVAGGVAVAGGAPQTAGTALPAHTMALLGDPADVEIVAREDSRIALIGGAPLGERHMWWNFVSSRRERIEQAKADWRDARFAMVPGETERAPLPERDAFFDKRG